MHDTALLLPVIVIFHLVMQPMQMNELVFIMAYQTAASINTTVPCQVKQRN